MDYSKHIDRMSESELRQVLGSAVYNDRAKAEAAARLKALEKANDALNERVAKRAAERASKHRSKPKGTIDSRSVRQGAENSLIGGASGSVIGTAVAGFNIYRELLEEGLAPSPETALELLSRLPEMLQLIVAWAIGVALVVFGMTLLHKSRKEY